MLLWMTIGILLTLGYPAHGEQCPSLPLSSLCSCHKKHNNMNFLACHYIKDINEISSDLEQTRGLTIDIIFYNSTFNIASDFFQGQKFKEVEIAYSNIKSLGSRPFTGLEDSLELIYIYESVHNDLALRFGHLEALKQFIFGGNDNVKKLGNEWFSGNPISLKKIFLRANGFEEIGEKVFADAINVEEISIGQNKFKEFSRSVFPRPANNLQKLHIDYNSFTDLPEDIFDDMPVLKYLDVSGNKLTTLSETVFGRVFGRLEQLRFYSNEGFKCDERMKWIAMRKIEKPLRSFLLGNCEEGKTLHEFLKSFDE